MSRPRPSIATLSLPLQVFFFFNITQKSDFSLEVVVDNPLVC